MPSRPFRNKFKEFIPFLISIPINLEIRRIEMGLETCGSREVCYDNPCNHGLVFILFQHTAVLPCLLLEKYLVFHEYPSKRKGISILVGFAMAYLVW